MADTPGGPLQVQPPTFVFKRIGQQTTFPGAINRITVTLATNILIGTKLEARLTISGLEGTAPLPWPEAIMEGASGLGITSKRVTDAGAVDFSGLFGLTGAWDGDDSTLVLALGRNMDQQQNYSFSFNVQNSLHCGKPGQVICGRGASTKVSLQAYKGSCRQERENFECPSAECGALSACTSRVIFEETDIVSAPGDGAPMLLDAPAFLVKSINSEAGGLPGELYTIFMSLSFNVRLEAPSQVVLSGLLGTDPTYSSTQVDGDEVVRNIFVFDKDLFDPRSGTLVLPLQEEVAVNPGQIYDVVFLVKLSQIAQDAPEVFVSTADGEIELASTLMDGTVLQIDPPAFVETSASQVSSHPGAPNTISIQLKPNVQLQIAQVDITVTGMFGAHNATLIAPQATRETWHQNNGTLVLTIGEKVDADDVFTISVNVTNSLAPQPPPVLQVRGQESPS